MKKMRMFLLMAAVFALIGGSVWGAPKKVALTDLLTAADVAKISGLAGAKLVPKNPNKGAGGDLNFATADGKLILMVQVVGKSYYAGYKTFFKASIKGLGEEAMQGATMPGFPNNQVVFVKGTSCVALTVFGDSNKLGKNMLTIDQTIALAKVMASRMIEAWNG